jgi:ornithine carbamoyltransferase
MSAFYLLFPVRCPIPKPRNQGMTRPRTEGIAAMKHLLSLADCSTAEVKGLLDLADKVKKDPAAYRGRLAHKKLAMIFQKPSTRTRVSFESGMFDLGGHALFLSSKDIQLGRGETVEDMAKVLSRMVDGVMARVFAHQHLVDLTTGSIPVINGLCDDLHPCQALADFQCLREHKGALEGLVLTYVGDGNNVAHSLIHAGAHLGVEVRVACPEGYEPDEKIVKWARDKGGTVVVTHDPAEGVQGADAVYTDVWASMGQEEEQKAREKIFEPFRVDMALFEKAKPDALFMHCLPAHRGEECTSEVHDHERSVVFDEAENRLHAQKAVLLHLMGGEALPG